MACSQESKYKTTHQVVKKLEENLYVFYVADRGVDRVVRLL